VSRPDDSSRRIFGGFQGSLCSSAWHGACDGREAKATIVFHARIATLLVCALLSSTAAAGKLGRVGDAARSSSGSSSSSASPGTSSSSHGGGARTGDGDVDADAVLIAGLLYVAASPWIIPHSAVEERRPPGAAARVRFAPYPYADGASGSLLEGRPAQALLERDVAVDAGPPVVAPADGGPPTSRKPVAVELGAEAAIGVDEDVVRSGFHARAQFPFRLGLDTSWSWYRELNGSRDQLGMGREHLNLRFAESSHVAFWSGLGPQHLVDSRGWVHGFDVTWAFQAFPVNPLVVAAEGSLGMLGNAFAPGARGELGFMLNRFEVSAGYEERWVGGIGLGGPFVSLTAWL
jgi:hypothetical protein